MDFRIKQIRESRGIKQQDIADSLGVNWRTYGSWERGERPLSVDMACKIADILDCSLDYLVGRDVRHDYDDPRERELHKCWGECTEQRRERLLDTARDFAGMSREVSERRVFQEAE